MDSKLQRLNIAIAPKTSGTPSVLTTPTRATPRSNSPAGSRSKTPSTSPVTGASWCVSTTAQR